MTKPLKPVFQPVVDMTTLQVTYYEALGRRADSADGHIRLIELGEQNGFIHLLDLGMLAQVMVALERRTCATIAVNVSVATIQAALGEVLALLFAHIDLAPRLVFEITETVKVSDWDKLDKFVTGVRLAGARIAIDDFGDGHADMALVERVRPEFVKLPFSAVDHLQTTGDFAPILALRERVEELGGTLIAEFVDSLKKVEMLKIAGVSHGQGYWFGRPANELHCSSEHCTSCHRRVETPATNLVLVASAL